MRVVAAETYVEPRDALAHDWGQFIASAFKETPWMGIPNLGKSVLDYVIKWNLNGFIFTGGNDLGESELRDETEIHLLMHALENRIPVFGVCRGLQLISKFFGHPPVKTKEGNHAGARHPVFWIDGSLENRSQTEDVNSYHNFFLPLSANYDGGPLRPIALDMDGRVECLIHEQYPIGGVMWHPERSPFLTRIDRMLFTSLFSGNDRLK